MVIDLHKGREIIDEEERKRQRREKLQREHNDKVLREWREMGRA